MIAIKEYTTPLLVHPSSYLPMLPPNASEEAAGATVFPVFLPPPSF